MVTVIQAIHQITTYLLNPFPWVISFTIFLYFKSDPKDKMLKKLFYLFWGIILVLSTPFLPHAILNKLESQHKTILLKDLDTTKQYSILVLGGGFGHDANIPETSLLNPMTLGRLIEGIRILNFLPHANLITSGNSMSGQTPQAIIAKKAAISLGVPEKLILTQETPWNTEEEAKEYSKNKDENTTLILVTCAYHMPRALAWFHRFGIKNIIAAPTNFNIKNDSKFPLITSMPHSENLSIFQRGVKEFVGTLLIKRRVDSNTYSSSSSAVDDLPEES